jgi:hypothetical protein
MERFVSFGEKHQIAMAIKNINIWVLICQVLRYITRFSAIL